MKKWAVLLALLPLQAPAAEVETIPSFTKGNELWEACNWPNGDRGAEHTCSGYIIGAIDAISTENRTAFCLPQHTTQQQATDIVKKWLKDHPEERHYIATYAVRTAIKAAFPCPAK